MKGHSRSLLQFLFIALCLSALVLAFAPSAHGQQGSAKVLTTKRGGLQTAIFDTLDGRVVVNLPDDMMAGDTISGTVLVEPKGEESEDKSMPIELLFDFTTVKVPTSGGSHEAFTIKIPANSGNDKPTGQIKLGVKGSDGASSYVNFDYGFWEYHVAATNEALGQQGRPVEIHGHFDGNFENTKVTVGGQEVPILAESPRKAIFESPRNSVGPAEIVIQEGKVETKQAFRNLRIRLSAPRTTLLKGESTTLTVKVEGLQGIKEDVPLHLENASPAVVRMEGGDQQTLRVNPSTLQPDGAFTATRTIASQEAGSFSVSATVVVFNRCLQDDQQPASVVLWDTFTGDYSFCRLDSKPGASDARIRTDGVMDFRGGVVVATSDTLDLNKQGGVLTFQSNNNDRRVLINLSAGVGPPSGSATIEIGNPKQTFTIRDRDTRDNTCTCK